MKSLFFSSCVYAEEDSSWLDSLNKFSDKYIEEAKEKNKKFFINNKDFGLVHHSSGLMDDINFLKFKCPLFFFTKVFPTLFTFKIRK